MKRTATSVWNGTGTKGSGHLSTQSGVFDQQPYSFKTRFENEDGKKGTNPEELIAAAHAGCFNMALGVQLEQAGFEPKELHTQAAVKLEKKGEGFAVTSIHLTLKGQVPGISADKFQELAKGAKENCPISQLLDTEIAMKAELIG
ncbi:MAG: OsmC family protein [Phaeodactylibacter sp.]|uniref:OsmC family protein n=1 Tax=Phaeodactylibacter sp. TaxID=1940289 RepID=UPI0032EC6A96